MSLPVTRRRDLTYNLGRGRITGVDKHKKAPFEVINLDTGLQDAGEFRGTQITVSEGHPWSRTNKRPKGDVGGDFFTSKTYVPNAGSADHGHRERAQYLFENSDYYHIENFNGIVLPCTPGLLSFPAPINSSNAQLNALGATAVARCKPTNSVAELATAVGELRKDGLPHLPGISLWRDQARLFRSLGKEYLNHKFGWQPFINDIRNVASAVSRANTVLKQFERDSGRLVRRHYSFPIQTEDTTSVFLPGPRLAYMVPPASQFWGGPRGDVVRRRVKTTRRWFSGAFTYHLPSGSTARGKLERYALEADKLLGVLPTPEVIWNLAPWSWAVDWFSNTGDVISNLSDYAVYGLVMQYGYIMEHSMTQDTYTMSGGTGLKFLQDTTPLTLVQETKIRRRANPFGFGVSWDGLSPTQLAIAAAIGVTR